MKCVCGYEDVILDKENNNRIVNEKFIPIGTINEEYMLRWDKITKCRIFACPKCGTLKLSLY